MLLLFLFALFFLTLFLTYMRFYKEEDFLEDVQQPEEQNKYDSNNYDIQYHDPVDVILKNEGGPGTWVKDFSNNTFVFIGWKDLSLNSTYYTPGTLLYGPKNYVPTYEDSVLLRYFKQKK